MNNDVEHTATIIAINGNHIDVTVDGHTSCEACKIRNVCGMDRAEGKFVTVFNDTPQMYEEGEQIALIASKGLGAKAVVLAYIIPFLLLVLSLLILSGMGQPELTTGLVSLGITFLYYLMLYCFRNKIEREIIFKIRKL